MLTSFNLVIRLSTLFSILLLSPVTPVTLTKYVKPFVFLDMIFILSKGVVGATNNIKSIWKELNFFENLHASSKGRSGIIIPATPALDANSQKFSSPKFKIGLK